MKHEETNIHSLRDHHAPYYHNDSDDEIDLRELITTLWKYKHLILTIAVAAVAIASSYLAITPKTYQAQAVITDAKANGIGELSLLSQPISHLFKEKNTDSNLNSPYFQSPNSAAIALLDTEIATEKLRISFTTTFSSLDNLYNFYNKENIYNHYHDGKPLSHVENLTRSSDKGFEQFAEAMQLTPPRKKAPENIITVTFQSNSQTHAEITLKKYLQYTNQIVTSNFSNTLKQEIERETEKLKRESQQQRALHSSQTIDHLTVLDEAITIARKLNLEYPSQKELDNLPLYHHGYAALEAEKQSLEKRTNNDAFIKNLRETENKIAYLANTQVLPKKIQAISFSESPNASTSPITPKTTLVLALASVLGIFIGIVTALLHNMLHPQKQINIHTDSHNKASATSIEVTTKKTNDAPIEPHGLPHRDARALP